MAGLFRMADAYVSVGIDDIFMGENAVRDDKVVEQMFPDRPCSSPVKFGQTKCGLRG